MAKVTMEQIIDFRNAIDTFSEMDLPLKAAYKINKIKKTVEKESDFYSEQFQEILNKYAKKDENGDLVFSESGDQIMIKDDMVDECNQALSALQNLEIQIDNYNFTIDDLGENLTCTPENLEALMPFME